MELHGEKVLLRPLTPEDIPAFARWLSDPQITADLIVPPQTRAECEQLLDPREGEWPFALCDRDGRLVGGIRLLMTDAEARQGTFGTFVGEPADRGRGYGSEAQALLVDFAFGSAGFSRIELHALARNERSIRACQRLGFRVVGLVPMNLYRGGHFLSTVVMELRREEWEARQTQPTRR